MIKNFIYLDTQKMYSLSSQLFEGITEYVLSEMKDESSDSETQKGPVGSGRLLADALIKSTRLTEKKFLHDYSFTVFEKSLQERGLMVTVDSSVESAEDIRDEINNCSFIKIKSRAIFNDINKITDLFVNFNAFGEALTHITSFEDIENIKEELKSLKQNQSKDREKLSRLETESKKLLDISKMAQERGLHKDQKFLNNLTLLTKYGFSDQFEIQQNHSEYIFTSCLKREFLRESEDLLVKKYSRKTEKEIVIIGMVSQAFEPAELNLDVGEITNMKDAMMNMVEHMTNIELSISGKRDNEVVIDPIAAYFEV